MRTLSGILALLFALALLYNTWTFLTQNSMTYLYRALVHVVFALVFLLLSSLPRPTPPKF